MKYLIIILLLCSTMAQAQFINNTGIQIVNSAKLEVNGDWVNASGTAFKNNGEIVTTEDWTNNGSLDAASTGGFLLKYTTDKTFTPGGSDFGFLAKEGAGNANIVGSISVKDGLAILGGLITPMSPTDLITAGGIVTSVPGSFIEGGKMVRTGTGNLFFPIGKAGVSLPITFINVNGANPSVSLTIEDAPSGYTGGAGVRALINFPYVWKTTKANVSDSAAYVEIEYPDNLTLDTDLVVVRKIKGQNKYEGMGARKITTVGGTTKVRSYSRGLQGTFSIATGYAGNRFTDSVALVSFYEATDGDSWTKRANWTATNIDEWEGVTETGGLITNINLPNNKIEGPVPSELADIAALETLDLSGNAITKLPVFTGSTGLTSLNVSNNKLDFASLEENANITGINYSNQAEIGSPQDVLVDVGEPYGFSSVTEGPSNLYQWKRNGVAVAGGNNDNFQLAAISRANMGTYICEVTNPKVPGLTISSASHRARAVASIAGKLQLNLTTPVTPGQVLLLKINPLGSAYDTTAVQNVKTDGTYNLEKVVLDDYILVGQGDKVLYDKYFPTYFDGTPFWEEADTLFLNEVRTGVDITLLAFPTVKPNGNGELFGVFSENNPGGRGDADRRIGGASCSVRRSKGTGRPKKTLAGEEIIDFLYTDANGEFSFKNLEQGTYLINFQYPGIPMDVNSDINITIGTKEKRQNVQKVDAVATGGKITVKRLLIVGLDDELQSRVGIFPNPTTEELMITLPQGGGEATLVDFLGRERMRIVLQKEATTLDVRKLETGIYILSIFQNGKEISRSRIVKE